MRQPSNKALAVLGLLRELGPSTVNEVADELRQRTPCGACNGTGDGEDSRWGCRRCYGRGRVPFGYSDAYVALKQLMGHGLVTRRHPRDEFGDECNWWVWGAADAEPSNDELEALYAMPSAEVAS